MLIQPVYVSKKANAPIALRSGPVYVTVEGTTESGKGRAQLRLAPRDGVVIAARFPGASAGRLFGTQTVNIQFGADGRPVPAIKVRGTLSEKGFEADFRPSTGNLVLCRDRRKRLRRAVFHILNFPNFFSSGEGSPDLRHRDGGGSCVIGRATLSQADWTIDIQALPGTADLIGQLKTEGGHAITHVGSLKRHDDRAFTIAAAERAIFDLHRFLSFARGQWTAVFGVAGYDARNKLVYEGLQERLSSPWGGTFRWFDPHHGRTLMQCYDGFARLLRDNDFGDAVNLALYWYLRSNRGGDSAGVDGGLVLSQAAFERLAIAASHANGLAVSGTAAGRMRRALLHYRIPATLSKSTPRLLSGKRAQLWTDGPDAITKIRNQLVHPVNRLPVKLGSYILEAWNLAQWYVEMMILRLAGYNGVYSNRIRLGWTGQVERVPWAKEKALGD